MQRSVSDMVKLFWLQSVNLTVINKLKCATPTPRLLNLNKK